MRSDPAVMWAESSWGSVDQFQEQSTILVEVLRNGIAPQNPDDENEGRAVWVVGGQEKPEFSPQQTSGADEPNSRWGNVLAQDVHFLPVFQLNFDGLAEENPLFVSPIFAMLLFFLRIDEPTNCFSQLPPCLPRSGLKVGGDSFGLLVRMLTQSNHLTTEVGVGSDLLQALSD